MKILTRMLFSYFFPVLLGGLLFAMLMLQLVDLFQNLNRYLSSSVSWDKIIQIQIFFIPKTLGWALPIALLFATNFSMGTLYSKNELIAVFTSGISIHRFTLPLIVFGIFCSLFHFFFEDMVIVDSNKLYRSSKAEALNTYQSFSQSNVSFISLRGRVVYNVTFYNFDLKEINQVTIVIRDDNGRFQQRIDAESGDWKDNGLLTLRKVRIFAWKDSDLYETWHENYSDPMIQENYDVFEQRMTKLEDLKITQAMAFLRTLEGSGLPIFREAQTDFYQRIAFAFSPLIVVLISSAIGGKFKKNILLMSLLISIGISVSYYIIQMITGLMARLGLLPPIIGSFMGVLIVGGVGIYLYKSAKT